MDLISEGRLDLTVAGGVTGSTITLTSLAGNITQDKNTAIVGTTRPDRWKQNAVLLDAGPLPVAQIEAILTRWHAIALPEWVGQG